MRIGLHADAGPGVGLGHLGRCAALAQAFAAQGHRPFFIDLAPEGRGWARAHGLRWTGLGSAGWDLIVADSYRLSPRRWAALRDRARRLLVIDDFGGRVRRCDWILSGTIDPARGCPRRDALTTLLSGPAFIPLRREYWRASSRRAASPRIRRVLVTLGGAAGPALLARAAGAVARALPDARVITGGSLPTLRDELRSSDVAVSGGGQTLYEAACAGTPAVAVRMAANQDGNLAAMTAAGCAVAVGPAGPDFEARLTAALRALDRDPAKRERMSRKGRALIDGRGALRVAKTVLG